MAGRIVAVADENHVAGAGLQHEGEILAGHDGHCVAHYFSSAGDLARYFYCKIGLARMVDGEGLATPVVDPSRGAVGSCDPLRNFAYPALEQVAHLGQQRAHSSLKLGSELRTAPSILDSSSHYFWLTGTDAKHLGVGRRQPQP
jgi:hypothetical protein